MVKEFKNKNEWALILGGSSGLGLASAKKLAKHGLNIIILHRNRKADLPNIQQEFEEIKNEDIQLKTFNIDATNPEKIKEILIELKNVLAEKGKIKTLIHSIAKGNLKTMTGEKNSLSATDFQLTIQAMAVSLFDWVQAIHQENLFAEDARVISFTSEGNTKAWKNYAAVSAAKVTLEAITRNIALEFAPFGIKANCIQAGMTDTFSFQQIPGSEQLKKVALNRNPNKRLTLPKDVANVVYLLCKDEAKWINGTIIPVDGGEHLS
ncbi:enoyl-ACP reductase FabI [Mesonia maritima]|uniref:Enoyl-[acyl-carrier protein] reductase I n=1 Tax=Mesonia maritima TaxID=1793873 RepID=A0ABU1K7K7_9FLAO|nr:SDR family oxidoreductase [Mesonia maritima]MDR6301606.1 enoyl-[acyl-carrier protein] reductase I [Mesonia maritima]